jgi:hypothetical protein
MGKRKSTSRNRKIGLFFFFSTFIVLAILYEIAFYEAPKGDTLRCDCHVFIKQPMTDHSQGDYIYDGLTREECMNKEIELFEKYKDKYGHFSSTTRNCEYD